MKVQRKKTERKSDGPKNVLGLTLLGKIGVAELGPPKRERGGI